MRNMAAKKRMPPSLLLGRIFAVMTVLGLTCLVVGFPLFMVGRISNELTVARVGAYVLLIEVALTIMRILYWIAEEVVGRGLESMAKQKYISYVVSAIAPRSEQEETHETSIT